MTHLRWRLAGVALLGICVVLYEPTADSALHRLVLPLGMALAAWLMVQNPAAVALGVFLLAAIHAAPGSADPFAGVAYPIVAATAGLLLIAIFVRRFRARIRATHQARWQHRRSSPVAETAGDTSQPARERP